LEILDRAGERGMTLQWRDVAAILRAMPSLKALRLDCNIDYNLANECTLDMPSPSHRGYDCPPSYPGRPPPRTGRSFPCNHKGCVAARAPVSLSELRDLYLDRYDITEVIAFLLQTRMKHLRSLILARVDVYPPPQDHPPRASIPRIPPDVRKYCLARVESLELREFDIDKNEATLSERVAFARDFISSFPSVSRLCLKNSTLPELFTALTPSFTSAHPPLPHLSLLTIVGGSSGNLFLVLNKRREAGLGIKSLFLINMKLDGGMEELPKMGNQVKLIDFVYLTQGVHGAPNMLCYPPRPIYPKVRSANAEMATRHRK
jgi:hypothetical protein